MIIAKKIINVFPIGKLIFTGKILGDSTIFF